MSKTRRSSLNYQVCEPRQLLAGISFNSGQVFIGGTPGNDVASINVSNGALVVSLTGFSDQSYSLSSVDEIRFVGADGNDRFFNNSPVPSFAYGSNGIDELIGGWGNDVLVGGVGNDEMNGRGGDDLIRGGGSPGTDVIVGGDGDDRLFASPDGAVIRGNGGDDVIFGGVGADNIHGNDGDDRIFPGHGVNTVRGGDGDDIINSGRDGDFLFGEGGSDRINGNGGEDEIDGGEGDDFLFGGGGSDTMWGRDGIDFMRGGDGVDIMATGNGVVGSRDRIFGDNGADILTGGPNEDFIDGGAGNDTINSLSGRDTVLGQTGDDIIDSGPGNDLVTGGFGDDTIDTGAGGGDVVQFTRDFDSYTITGSNPITVTDDVGNDGTDSVSNVETFRFSDGDRPAGNDFEVVYVRPIVVSNNNGSNTAEFFGNASSELFIKNAIDDIFAVAEIDIEWEATRSWNNTFANIGNSGNGQRPNADLTTIVNDGDSAGIGSSDALVIDMYFVEVSAGFAPPSGENNANGLAYVGAPGITMQVGDNLVDFELGREVVAEVAAHEIAHNLGLSHNTITGNLMNNIGTGGTDLTQSQIDDMIDSDLSQSS